MQLSSDFQSNELAHLAKIPYHKIQDVQLCV